MENKVQIKAKRGEPVTAANSRTLRLASDLMYQGIGEYAATGLLAKDCAGF